MSKPANATDTVFERLRQAIITGALPAGERFSVYGLAAEYGISRTPIREAVLRLADLGMVSIERNRGFTVRRVSVEDIREVFELRLLLEVPAAAHAASSVTPEMIAALDGEMRAMRKAARVADREEFMRHDLRLHELIALSLGNARLGETLRALRESTLSRGAVTSPQSRGLRAIDREHAPIVAAIAAADPDAAAAQMRAHLVSTGTLLMKQAAKAGGEEVPEGWATKLPPSSGQ